MILLKKGISPVVAIALLLVVAVVSVVSFQGWFSTYSSNVFVGVEEKSDSRNSVILDSLIGNSLYILNNVEDGLNVTGLKIDGVECVLNNLSLGVNEVDVSSCMDNVSSSSANVVLVTKNDVISKTYYVKDVSGSLSGGGGSGPVCNYNAPENFHGGDGTLGNPWQICDCGQLQNVTNYLGGNFTLANNVDCSDTLTWNAGAGFEPIGVCVLSCTAGGDDYPFRGSFDGAGYVISNLYINRPASSALGLFSYTYDADITNVGLSNVDVWGVDFIGGLVGYQRGGTVTDSYALGVINASSTVGDRVGGLLGYVYANSLIDNVYFVGNVSGNEKIGGLIGYNRNNINIDNSYANVGFVLGVDDLIGGLIGGNYDNIIVNNSYVVGDLVSGRRYVGGLTGYIRVGAVDNSYTTLNIINASQNGVGGLIGLTYDTDVTNSYSDADIWGGGDNTGGLIGYLWMNSVLDNSYALGEVNSVGGGVSTGGLVGYISYHSVIDNSYSTGDVVGANYIGGLVGRTYNSGISNSYTEGNVNGTDRVGGLIGYNFYHNNVDNSYAIGDVFGNDQVGGLIGYNSYDSNIDNSYSVGAVSGSTNLGGLIGVNSGSVVTDSYWDNETSGQTSSSAGTGLDTALMMQQATYSGWDFASVWQIVEGVSYPTLR